MYDLVSGCIISIIGLLSGATEKEKCEDCDKCTSTVAIFVEYKRVGVVSFEFLQYCISIETWNPKLLLDSTHD